MATKLFVGGLPWAMDNKRLEEVFAAYGDVADARVVLDRETGRSRGFGFVTYKTPEGAEKALELNDQEVDGRRIRVDRAQEKARSTGRRPRGDDRPSGGRPPGRSSGDRASGGRPPGGPPDATRAADGGRGRDGGRRDDQRFTDDWGRDDRERGKGKGKGRSRRRGGRGGRGGGSDHGRDQGYGRDYDD